MLTNFGFLEAKVVALGPQPLIDDYQLSNDSVLRAFQNALRQEAHILRAYPNLVWQQLYNRLQWEAESVLRVLAPELERHSAPGAAPWLWLHTPWSETQGLMGTLTGHTSAVNACVFSPDGTTIASGSMDRTIILWDAQSGEICATLIGHIWAVNTCAFSPDGTTLLSASRDGTLRLWDTQTGHERVILGTQYPGHTHEVLACVFSLDGTMLLSASADYTLRLWDADSGQLRRVFTGHVGAVTACAFSPDGTTILSGSSDHTLKLWDVASGQVRMTLTGHTGEINDCTFSPDGSMLLSVSTWGRWRDPTAQTVRFCDAKTGHELAAWNDPAGYFTTCSFGLDANTFLLASTDSTLRLWDLHTRHSHIFTGHTGWIRACAFSPDGTTIISGSDDKTLKLWDIASGQLRMTLTGHIGGINDCAFTPDGCMLLSVSKEDRTLKLWDVQTGCEYASLQLSRGPLCLALHPQKPCVIVDSGGGASGYTHTYSGDVYSGDMYRVQLINVGYGANLAR